VCIAHDIKNQRKPRRGGTVLPGANRAAPAGLARFIGGGVATDMPLLWSWLNSMTNRFTAETQGSQKRCGLWAPHFSAISASLR